MIPLIIHGGSVTDRASYISDTYPEGKYVVTRVVAEKSSILISQVHDVIKGLGVTANLPRLIWFEEAQGLTMPAQNALLKLLEEPPEMTQIVLSVDNPHSLLATIRSRCKLQKVEVEDKTVDADLSLLKQAMGMSAGDRILAADSVGRKREIVLAWVSACLTTIDRKIKTEKSVKSITVLTTIAGLLHSAYVDLRANVAVSLVMQNLFLSLPHTKR